MHPVKTSYSQHRVKRLCDFKWLLSYPLGVKAVQERSPIFLGSLVHDLLQRFYRSQQLSGAPAPESVIRLICGGPTGLKEGDSAEAVDFLESPDLESACASLGLPHDPIDPRWLGVVEAQDLYLKSLIDKGKVPTTHEDRQELMGLAEDIFWNYWATWADHDAQRYQVVSTEGFFSGNIRTPSGRIARGKEYRGRRDLVVRDLEDGLIKIIEHKTSGDRRWETTIEKYAMDHQGHGYVMFGEGLWTSQDRPLSVLYNIIRTTLPGAPKVVSCSQAHKGRTTPCTKCGTIEGKAPDGSKARAISMAAVDTSQELFRQAVEDLGVTVEGDEDYARIHDGLKDNWYFHREDIPVTDHDLQVFQLRTYKEMTEIGEALIQVEKFVELHGGTISLEQLIHEPNPYLLAQFPRSAPWACNNLGKCEFLPICSKKPDAASLFTMRGQYAAVDETVEEGWDSDIEV